MNGSHRRALHLACAALLAEAAFPGGRAQQRRIEPSFVETSERLGIDFRHRHFGTGEKYMPENMGPGVAIFDADGDGRLDLYLVQGAPLPATASGSAEGANRLYRQLRDGTFVDITNAAGVGDRGYGMGASFGDIDGDGDLDLYVTNFGPNRLYRNRGDGSFEDATDRAGVAGSSWSTSSGFFDADGDGDLDLYVVNYVDFSFANHRWCGDARRQLRAYCHPDVYSGQADVLYRNDGDGRFTDSSREAGLLSGAAAARAKGLGVAFADLNGDRTIDIYVANDSTMNHLYLGSGDGRFREAALLSGLGFNGSGAAEASMGVEIGDVDGDGAAEIFLTHLDEETNTLYRSLGEGIYADVTEEAGLAVPSRPWVGFGTVLLDHDHDGDLDLFVANGHIIDNIDRFDPARSHRQPSQLFDNLTRQGSPGRFIEISGELGLPEPLVGRGAAAGDLDGDGDLDLVVTQNDDRALVLSNRVASSRGSSVLVRLRGSDSNPQGFGARLELRLAGQAGNARTLVRWAKSASSYLSQSAPEVHFWLGPAASEAELRIDWPSGRINRYRGVAPDRLYIVSERKLETRGSR